MGNKAANNVKLAASIISFFGSISVVLCWAIIVIPILSAVSVDVLDMPSPVYWTLVIATIGMIIGLIFVWVIKVIVYGFGELIESNSAMLEQMGMINFSINKPTTNSTSSEEL